MKKIVNVFLGALLFWTNAQGNFTGEVDDSLKRSGEFKRVVAPKEGYVSGVRFRVTPTDIECQDGYCPALRPSEANAQDEASFHKALAIGRGFWTPEGDMLDFQTFLMAVGGSRSLSSEKEVALSFQVYNGSEVFQEATEGGISIESANFNVDGGMYKPAVGHPVVFSAPATCQDTCWWRQLEILPQTEAPIFVRLIGDARTGFNEQSVIELWNVGSVTVKGNEAGLSALVARMREVAVHPVFKLVLGHEVSAVARELSYLTIQNKPTGAPVADTVPGVQLGVRFSALVGENKFGAELHEAPATEIDDQLGALPKELVAISSNIVDPFVAFRQQALELTETKTYIKAAILAIQGVSIKFPEEGVLYLAPSKHNGDSWEEGYYIKAIKVTPYDARKPVMLDALINANTGQFTQFMTWNAWVETTFDMAALRALEAAAAAD